MAGFTRIKVDAISQAIGDRRFMAPYYPKGLRQVVQQRYDPPVSRFYQWTAPNVVVDFEPPTHLGRMWIDEKRGFFHEQGIVYVAVLLREKITLPVFKARLEEAKSNLLTYSQERALSFESSPGMITVISDDAFREQAEAQLSVDEAGIAPHRRLRGRARVRRLATLAARARRAYYHAAQSGDPDGLGRQYRVEQLAVTSG
jgi:hypothetical protein